MHLHLNYKNANDKVHGYYDKSINLSTTYNKTLAQKVRIRRQSSKQNRYVRNYAYNVEVLECFNLLLLRKTNFRGNFTLIVSAPIKDRTLAANFRINSLPILKKVLKCSHKLKLQGFTLLSKSGGTGCLFVLRHVLPKLKLCKKFTFHYEESSFLSSINAKFQKAANFRDFIAIFQKLARIVSMIYYEEVTFHGIHKERIETLNLVKEMAILIEKKGTIGISFNLYKYGFPDANNFVEYLGIVLRKEFPLNSLHILGNDIINGAVEQANYKHLKAAYFQNLGSLSLILNSKMLSYFLFALEKTQENKIKNLELKLPFNELDGNNFDNFPKLGKYVDLISFSLGLLFGVKTMHVNIKDVERIEYEDRRYVSAAKIGDKLADFLLSQSNLKNLEITTRDLFEEGNGAVPNSFYKMFDKLAERSPCRQITKLSVLSEVIGLIGNCFVFSFVRFLENVPLLESLICHFSEVLTSILGRTQVEELVSAIPKLYNLKYFNSVYLSKSEDINLIEKEIRGALLN